jgi:hypothetical protein
VLSETSPGQAAHEAHQAAQRRRFPGIAPVGWDEFPAGVQAEWETIARSGIAAYIEANGRDPVDARAVILEAAGLEPQAALELAAAMAARDEYRDNAILHIRERDAAREQLAVIRERLGILAAQFELSASYSHPSKKSEIEQGCAQAVRGIAEG